MIDAFAYALLGAGVVVIICLTVRYAIGRVCQSREKNTEVICGTIITGLIGIKGEYVVKKMEDE